jgi:hypothetical protein
MSYRLQPSGTCSRIDDRHGTLIVPHRDELPIRTEPNHRGLTCGTESRPSLELLIGPLQRSILRGRDNHLLHVHRLTDRSLRRHLRLLDVLQSNLVLVIGFQRFAYPNQLRPHSFQ